MKTFIPPSVLEVTEYAASINYLDLDAAFFCLYYGQRGWMISYSGKLAPMKNWKIAVQTWKHNDDKRRALETTTAQSVVDMSAIRQRLLNGEHVTRAEKNKLPIAKQYMLSEDDEGLWYYTGSVTPRSESEDPHA